ncbi:hypothetical protein SLEP1_g2556 [Rubroshorea leprosula]|uniref:Uncharacterized protein n=1 Tax=Rubroshorea leprosula TaxID=152421 RepID=A0AAV5HR96_9ROSI|nr:hypothetical protein SLEP1_g2556 [Rubroshorea leprosula]
MQYGTGILTQCKNVLLSEFHYYSDLERERDLQGTPSWGKFELPILPDPLLSFPLASFEVLG